MRLIIKISIKLSDKEYDVMVKTQEIMSSIANEQNCRLRQGKG